MDLQRDGSRLVLQTASLFHSNVLEITKALYQTEFLATSKTRAEISHSVGRTTGQNLVWLPKGKKYFSTFFETLITQHSFQSLLQLFLRG